MSIRVFKLKQKYPTTYIYSLPPGLHLAEGQLLEDQQNPESSRIFSAGTREPTPSVIRGQHLAQL
jgi:hypothetical protein